MDICVIIHRKFDKETGWDDFELPTFYDISEIHGKPDYKKLIDFCYISTPIIVQAVFIYSDKPT